jgi:hypothetical protein
MSAGAEMALSRTISASQTHHLCESSGGHDVSGMHKSVEMPRRLLDLLPHVIVDFHVENIGDQVERILVVLDFRVEAGQVEAIGEIVFVDFTEVFIAT